MSAAAGARGRRRKKHGGDHGEEHESEERWLLTYADMITLLMTLFMVLFSISSVNTSKFSELQRALQDAFSGAVLSGGHSVMQTGSDDSGDKQSSVQPPLPALMPLQALNASKSSTQNQDAQAKQQAAQQEQADLSQLKQQIDLAAKNKHLDGKIQTSIERRGLVVKLLTDGIFFDSGSATLKSAADPILKRIGVILRDERKHSVVVEGYTDSQPIHGSLYPSNWELSGARAGTVVRVLSGVGVLQQRLSLSGYGSEQPAATNTTAAGRSQNRRVEIVLPRQQETP